MDELVIKPVDGSGGKGIVMGPMCEKKELDAARKRIIADPPAGSPNRWSSCPPCPR